MLGFVSFDFDLGDRESGGGGENRKNIIKLFFVFKYVWVLVGISVIQMVLLV